MKARIAKRIRASILPTLLLTASITVGAADALSIRYYEDAVSRFNGGDLDGAEVQLKNALSRDPGQLSARILMGRILLQRGQALAAEEELTMANKLGADPLLTALPLAKARNALGRFKTNIETLIPTAFPVHEQPEIWVELALARLATDDLDGAEIAFKQALAIEPLHATATIGLARVPLERGEFTVAEQMAALATANAPDDPQAWFVKASALHAQGRNIDAAAAYARAKALDPADSAAALGEAAALLDAGEAERAIAALAALRESHPWTPEAPYLQARAYQQLGRDADARSALDAAAEILDPTPLRDLQSNPVMLRLASVLALEKGQLERAYQAVSAYLQTGSNDVDAHKLFARIALAVDKPAEARRALVSLVSAGKADAEVIGLLGDASAKSHDFVTAESYYREALSRYQGGPALAGRLGVLQYRQGQHAAGLQTLQGLVRDHVDEITLGTSLYTAMLSFAEGDHATAREITLRILQREPDNLPARNLDAALAIADGNYDDARGKLDALLQLDPSFRPARYNLAKLNVIEKRYREAEGMLRQMLVEHGEDQRALLELARLEGARGDRRGAIGYYEKIRQINPKAVGPIVELVDMYIADGRRADAASTIEGLVRSQADSFPAHVALARVQLSDGRLDEARATLQKASTLAGYDTRQLLQAALLQRAAAAYDDAVWTLSKLLEEQPDSLDAKRALADVQLRRGAFGEAKQLAEQVLQVAPDDLYTLTLRGDIHSIEGEHDRAVEMYQRALAVEPRALLVVSQYRARTLAGHGDAALEELKRWVDAHPDQPETLRALAERYHQLGRTEEAVSLYQRLVETAPNDALAFNNLAELLVGTDSERAFKAARRAYELQPDNPAILDTIGWALVQIGDLDQGIAHLRNAVARNGGSAAIRYHLGAALEEYGSRAEARRQLEQALKLAQGQPAWLADARTRLERLP